MTTYIETTTTLDDLEVKIVDWRREHDMETDHGSKLDMVTEAEMTTYYGGCNSDVSLEIRVRCRAEGCKWERKPFYEESES